MSIPFLHQTDLFHPHADPDDHWDLACVYALARAGHYDLRGVLIDYPPPALDVTPDVMGVAQLNQITGLAVPSAVGSAVPVRRRGEKAGDQPAAERHGVEFLLRILRESPVPVVITIVGSCRDVALAGAQAPELFREKCRAVYLNAGSGTRRPELLGELEYNVNVNPAAYGAIFDLQCPVYWMPCFEITPPTWTVEEWGTFYRFTQDEILPHLSPRVQAYFLYMLGRSPSTDWLKVLREPVDATELPKFGALPRNMWCTAGFFHATGRTVTADGDIVPLTESGERAVFGFEPIRANCGDDGVVRWESAAAPGDPVRFIFRVRDRVNYTAAMTRAMRTLLATLP
ncbi:MAG: hypothetical protein RLZZ129_2004 [Verrucomicrobiota bacterium]